MIVRAVGESHQELMFACDSAGCYQGHVLE